MMEPERAERLMGGAVVSVNAAFAVQQTLRRWHDAKAGRPSSVPPFLHDVLDPAEVEAQLAVDIENFQKIARRLK